MGPRYEHLFREAALTVMADPAGGTFIDIPKLFEILNMFSKNCSMLQTRMLLNSGKKKCLNHKDQMNLAML